jgi:hypothetical protein
VPDQSEEEPLAFLQAALHVNDECSDPAIVDAPAGIGI